MIRPSALPKLAACGQFRSAPGGSDAARRGTLLDNAFRAIIENEVIPEMPTPEDCEAVNWAVLTARELAGDGLLRASARATWLPVPGMPNGGTVDAIAFEAGMSFDLKSGQEYDYAAQMAAYALGAFEGSDEIEEWTTHLLFCDQRRVVTHQWTQETAWHAVQTALLNRDKPPTPNQFCAWCVNATTCQPRLDAQASALAVQQPQFVEIMLDPERLGRFLDACQTLDDFRDRAKERARDLLSAGQEVPGWKLGKARATQLVRVADLEGLAPIDKILEAAGSITLKEALALAPTAPITAEVKTSKPPLVRVK